MKILTPQKAFKFCLKCGSKVKLSNSRYFACNKCGFHFYINPLPTNAVIIENKKGQILLVKRGVEPKKGLWDLPGGFIEPEETLENSVSREIKEELNISVIKNTIKIIGVYPDTYDYLGVREPTLTIVVCCNIKKGQISPQDDVSEFKFTKKENVVSEKIAFYAVKKGLKKYLTQFLRPGDN